MLSLHYYVAGCKPRPLTPQGSEKRSNGDSMLENFEKLHWVYFAESVAFVEDSNVSVLKIGCASQITLYENLVGLRRGNPNPMDYIGLIPFNSKNESLAGERALHDKFRKLRFQGEWFVLSEELQEYVNSESQAPDEYVEASHANAILKTRKRRGSVTKAIREHRKEQHRLRTARLRALQKLDEPEVHAKNLKERNRKYRERQIAAGATVHAETHAERDAMQEEARELRKQGLSYSKIAAHFEKNIAWARRATKGVEKGVDEEEMELREKARQMRADGMKLDDIDRELGRYRNWAAYVTKGVEVKK